MSTQEKGALKYGAPILFLSPIPIQLPEHPEVIISLRPFTHKEVSTYIELGYLIEETDNIRDIQVYDTVLTSHTVKITGAIGFPSNKVFIEQLPLKLKKFLYEKLMTLSIVSEEQLKNIEEMIEVQFNPMFQEESWDCKICQAKGLDYTRACGFLPKDKRDSSPMLPRVNGKRLTSCPISTLNYYILNQASQAHTYWTSGNLPEEGGAGNQTNWFVKVALLFKRKVAEAEQEAIQKAKEK